MRLYFTHPEKENLSINFGQFSQITGQNKQLKYYIWQLLFWYFDGKKYKYEDLSLFDQKEPVILKEEEEEEIVKRTEFKVISISSIRELIAQMEYKKGTVSFEYLKIKLGHLEIMEQLDFINDKLLQISNIANQTFNLKIEEVSYHTEAVDFTTEQLILKNFLPYFELRHKNISFEFVENKIKFLLFLEILSVILEHSTEKIILLLRNMDSYLDYTDFVFCCERLQELCCKFPHFHIIHFPTNDNYLYMNRENLQYINIFSDLIEHYYDFSFMYERFIRHYPSSNLPNETDFLSSLRRIASYLFSSDLGHFSFSADDMIAIKILNKLYNYDKNVIFHDPETDPLMLRFLKED